MENKKNNNIYKSIMLVIITALITCILTTIIVYNAITDSTGTTEEDNLFKIVAHNISNIFTENNSNVDEIESKLKEINKKINETYIGDINQEKLMEGAIEGYVAALGDEYTEYLNKEEVQQLLEEVDGSYVGIGVYISKLIQSNEIVVVGVVEDSPAHKKGILVGDIIKKVDGVEYSGDELNNASDKMRGPEGTNVKVIIERKEEEKEIEITREKIQLKYTSSEILENNIGYIKISSFEGNCASDFEKHYKNLESKGIKSLIIDLRNNGGGIVDESLKIADFLLPKDVTSLITVDKKNNEEITKTKNDAMVKVPVVILVNGYTASASEILTGAVKENTDYKIVGTKTYGKGVIQGIYLLSDKETALKVTIQEYFTPNKNKINKTGITPDYEVELPEEWKNKSVIEKQYDTQLKKAIELLK